MNIILDTLTDFVSHDQLSKNSKYKLYLKIENTKTLFIDTSIMIILLIMDIDEIFLEEINNSIYEYKKSNAIKINISCYWFVCSRKGSIYLFESIVNENKWKKNKSTNKLCVLNSDNGIVCLSPGHIKNNVISERIRNLLEEYRITQKDLWNKKMFDIFRECLKNMKNK